MLHELFITHTHIAWYSVRCLASAALAAGISHMSALQAHGLSEFLLQLDTIFQHISFPQNWHKGSVQHAFMGHSEYSVNGMCQTLNHMESFGYVGLSDHTSQQYQASNSPIVFAVLVLNS